MCKNLAIEIIEFDGVLQLAPFSPRVLNFFDPCTRSWSHSFCLYRKLALSLSKAIAAVHVYISIRWVTSSERNRAILNSVMVEGSEVCSRSSQAGSLASSFERLCKFPTTPWLNESMVNRNSHTDWLLSCHKVGAVNRPPPPPPPSYLLRCKSNSD